MFRRTYRSKKDTGGGLDPKEMLNNMDEKDSVFDAFYIQNIKQTKREQSCMGPSNPHGAGTNRVSKRKYVRRIIKEVEQPARESLSGSVFLTPDKSLHVNKAPDLFDQLLNSSPAMPQEKMTKKMDPFDKLLTATPKQGKTYTRKKKTAVKKFDYSSNSSGTIYQDEMYPMSFSISYATGMPNFIKIGSGINNKQTNTLVTNQQPKIASDKENSGKGKDSFSQDITDIRSHELVIEKESAHTPKIDESINNIVRKLTLINNIKNRSSGSLKTSFKCHKNRLTRNLPSPLLKDSPLSSTPFTEKCRSKSIYNFSPIQMGNLTESPNYVTVKEHDNNEPEKSIILVPKHKSNSLKKSLNEDTASPVISYNVTKNKGNSKPLFSSENDSKDDSSKKSEDSKSESCKGIMKSEDSKSNELSAMQISEMEPFLGFDNYDNVDNVDKNLSVEDEQEVSIIISTVISKNSKSKESNKSGKDASQQQEDIYNLQENNSAIEYTIPPEPFLGFSKLHSPEEKEFSQRSSCNEVSVIDVLTDNLTSQANIGLTEVTDVEHNPEQKELVTSLENKETDRQSDTSSSDSTQDIDSQSLYDTCSSEEYFGEVYTQREPIVAIERMDMELFNKYYIKQAQESISEDTDSEENKNDVIDEDYVSFNDSSGEKDQFSTSSNAESDITTTQSSSDSSIDINSSDKNETVFEHRKSNEDRISNFVTTRRRNEFTNNSTILVLDDSEENYSENDNSALSNKVDLSHTDNVNVTVQNTETENDVSVVDENEISEENVPDIKINVPISPEIRSSNITVRNSKAFRDSGIHSNAAQSIETVNVSVMDNNCVPDQKINQPTSPETRISNITVRSSKLLGDSNIYNNFNSAPCVGTDEVTIMNKNGVPDIKINNPMSPETRISNITVRNSKSFRDSNIYNNFNAAQSVGTDEVSILNKNGIPDLKINKPTSPETRISNITVRSSESFRDSNININAAPCTGTDEVTMVNKNFVPDIKINEPMSPETRISNITVRNSKSFRDSSIHSNFNASNCKSPETKPIILQPGKKWERSLSIYRRMTMANDHFNSSLLEEEDLQTKGRKYRLSVITTMEMQDQSSLHNETVQSRRSTFIPKPNRSTIRIVKETSNPRLSLSTTTVFDDLKGFLEDCDDTIVELSKLSLADDHEVTVVDKFHEDSRTATARDYVLRRCNQTDTIPFDECYPDSLLKNCRKIGEGVYGEVFLWRAPDGRARVMKVVPIAGQVKVNGEQQKHFHEIIAEIVIAMELSALRAPIPEIECHLQEGKDCDELDLHSVENATDVFNEVLAVRCVFGSYPSRLLDLWELYDECRGSENDNPAVLPADQQYIVLELANAGQDLESFQFNSAEQAHALFLQVSFALAVGEEAFQFEHRDLHWGNVLIAPTDQKYATFVLRGRAHRVPRRGVAATIIDYSLSRVSLPLGPARADSAALYNDLATDDGLFAAVGDYQFEVYRLMRDKLGNDWKNFEPYTNILWLHYTVDKMITALRYKRTNTKTHKQYINKLKAIKQRILDYHSAAQFVLTDLNNEY